VDPNSRFSASGFRNTNIRLLVSLIKVDVVIEDYKLTNNINSLR